VKYSSIVKRISGEAVAAWDIHFAAVEAGERGEDVIVLSIGDPDFATDSEVCAALTQALEAGDTHYTDMSGRLPLREAIAARQRKVLGIECSAEQVAVVAGTQNGLYSVATCLFEAGDEVIVPEPMYLTYPASISAGGATLVPVEQPADKDFRLSLKVLEAAITPRTRGIAIATPNNPSGNVYSDEELEAIAQVAIKHNLWVISDEVYDQMTYDRPHLSIATLPGMRERTVIIGSLSKSHAMTGWRVGWVIGPVELMKHLDNLLLCMFYGLPGFIQQAALKALELNDPIVAHAKTTFRRRRDLVVNALKDAPLLSCKVPEAGMFMLVDVRKTGLSSMDFAWKLFRETGVSVLDAEAFGPSCRGFVRLSFTVSDENLSEACSRIARFTARLQAEMA